MFLDKYLNSVYMDIIYDTYDEEYLKSLDENNFLRVCSLLKSKGFYFIEDIIIKYLELFEIDVRYIERAINDMERKLGSNYINILGNNINMISDVIDNCYLYMEEDM